MLVRWDLGRSPKCLDEYRRFAIVSSGVQTTVQIQVEIDVAKIFLLSLQSEEIFLDMFEDEYREMKVGISLFL